MRRIIKEDPMMSDRGSIRLKLRRAGASMDKVDHLMDCYGEKTVLYAWNYYSVQKKYFDNILDFIDLTCERVTQKRKKRNE